MKNKNIFICSFLIILLIFSIVFIYQNNDKKEMKNNTSELISFYIETENNKYEKTKDLNFPTEGYVLNEAKSNCENNSELSWINNKIQLTGNKSDRCYIYFDNVVKDYDYTGSYQEFIVPVSGTYKIEVWGASGGDINTTTSYIHYKGGNGGYSSGNITLKKTEILYIYIGEKGIVRGNATFNGGGLPAGYSDDYYCASGGGASDIRLSNGQWNNFESLKSRIMVAGGGAGAERIYPSGVGGGLKSTSSNYSTDIATQTTGYKFGIGMDATGGANASGAGGGYYGGKTSKNGITTETTMSSAGGSGFISGYTGCVAIKEESTEDNVQPKDNCTDGTENIECSYHYSGKIFTETKMLAGNETMPSPEGSDETGHSGNGYARITYLGK